MEMSLFRNLQSTIACQAVLAKGGMSAEEGKGSNA
jgi:hypothetical protein